MFDLIMLILVISIGSLLALLIFIQLLLIVFRPSLNRFYLRFRPNIIQNNRIKRRGFLYSNRKRKDCWI